MVLQICQVVSIVFKCFSHLFTSFHGFRALGDLLFQALLLGDPIQPQLGRLSTSVHQPPWFQETLTVSRMKAERFGPVPGWSNSGCIRMMSLENDHSFFLYHPIPVKTTIIYNSLFKILWQFRASRAPARERVLKAIRAALKLHVNSPSQQKLNMRRVWKAWWMLSLWDLYWLMLHSLTLTSCAAGNSWYRSTSIS